MYRYLLYNFVLIFLLKGVSLADQNGQIIESILKEDYKVLKLEVKDFSPLAVEIEKMIPRLSDESALIAYLFEKGRISS